MTQKIFKEELQCGTFEVWDDKPDFKAHHVHQIHSTEIVKLDQLDIKSDGIIFENTIETPIAIKTADCLPIILQGMTHSVFLHAGWAGLANGILDHDFIKEINFTNAFIGPSIQVDHFEVQEDFKAHFEGSHHFLQKNDKLYFDLQSEANDRINRLNPDAIIKSSQVCTHCDNKYNSYRRDKTPKRNWNIWTL